MFKNFGRVVCKFRDDGYYGPFWLAVIASGKARLVRQVIEVMGLVATA